MSPTPAFELYRVRVQLVRDAPRPPPYAPFTNSSDVYQFLRGLEYEDRETFHCVHLDVCNRVLSCEEVSRGSLTGALVAPREVFKAAMLANASSVIVAHNHPSGDPTPSEEDFAVTKRLRASGEILGIPVLDSLILGASTYYSFCDQNTL